MSETACQLVVAGRVDDSDFVAARTLGEELAQRQSNVTLVARALVGTDWEVFLADKVREWGLAEQPRGLLCFYNRKHYIGDAAALEEWISRVYGRPPPVPRQLALAKAREALVSTLRATKHSYCFLDMVVAAAEEEAEGKEGKEGKEGREASRTRVLVELYDEVCPKTCSNFRMLCTGEKGRSYAGTPFHRVVEGGWVQGGDVKGGSGAGGVAVLGSSPTFADETFAVKHDKVGVISMANAGKPHTNGSQFFVTLQALPWLDNKRVAFGRVVFGMTALNAVAAMPRKNERPVGLAVVYNCGVYDIDTDTLTPSADAEY